MRAYTLARLRLVAPALVLMTAALICIGLPAHAAQPGAFSVTETKSAVGDRPAKPPRTKNRCLGPELFDAEGFLYPEQLLAHRFSQCDVKDSRLIDKHHKQWMLTCGVMLTAHAEQDNSGDDLRLHIDAVLMGGMMRQTIDYDAKALHRACQEDDSQFK